MPPTPTKTPLDRPATGGVLFTAFEPSGDEHASAVIEELKRRHPALPIYAWGGAKMELAGASLVERTGDDAVMGMPGLSKIMRHKRINQRIDAWLREHPVALHVPVDSPAANTPICEIARGHGLRVVHLVAPQIWAWGRWRIHKLRRLTDLVLCVLPFEVAFFERRRVPARFIGHFLFDHPPDDASLRVSAAGFPAGSPKVAIMPGSRPGELERHWPVFLEVFRAIRAKHPGATGLVAATSPGVAEFLRTGAERYGGMPDGLGIVADQTDAVIHWCDLSLVKSGTVTLQVARQRRPMVVFYSRTNPVLFMIARVLLSTRLFSLPNVLARRPIVPEFVQHFGGAAPIVEAALELIENPEARARQATDIDEVLGAFRGFDAASLAADAIEESLGLSNSKSLAPAQRAPAP